jgi:ELWxxDGT repeat protein
VVEAGLSPALHPEPGSLRAEGAGLEPGQTGPELWRSDGSPGGTDLFANLLKPDPDGSSPFCPFD